MDSMPFTIKKVGTSQLQRDASVLSHCTRALLSFLHGTPTFLMAPAFHREAVYHRDRRGIEAKRASISFC